MRAIQFVRILLLLVALNVLPWCQVLEFRFSDRLNSFIVPADTKWREYRIPYEILAFNPGGADSTQAIFSPYVLPGESYPDSSNFWVDLIHYPSNALEDFEDSAHVMIEAEDVEAWYDYSYDTPDASISSLRFGYRNLSESGSPPFSIFVTDPLVTYPVVPDSVGFWIKAEQSSDLTRFIPLDVGNLWQWDKALRGVRTLSAITGSVFTDCTATWQTNDWFYRGDSVVLSHRVFSSDDNHPNKVLEMELFDDGSTRYRREWDFGLLPGEYNPGEPLFPVDEYYGTILARDAFLKVFEPQVYIYYNSWYFAYGIGLVKESGFLAGTDTLTGARVGDEYLGRLSFHNSLSVDINRSEIRVETFPDSGWHEFYIPLGEMLLDSDFDSEGYAELRSVTLSPHIVMPPITDGIFLVDNLEVTSSSHPNIYYVIDDFEEGADQWVIVSEPDESYVILQVTEDTPTGTGHAMKISFGSPSGQNFYGALIRDVDSTDVIRIHKNDKLKFWLKEVQTPLAITPSRTIPEYFVLGQNYPNPFNPTTTIEFSVPRSGLVTLTVYDLLGRKLETILNQRLDAGYHKVQWNASEIPSGIYLLSMRSGDFTQTRKVTVLR